MTINFSKKLSPLVQRIVFWKMEKWWAQKISWLVEFQDWKNFGNLVVDFVKESLKANSYYWD